jgi:hypothetical protein
LVSVECRTTMCLVEVRHADTNASRSWLRGGFKGWPGALFIAGDVDKGGSDEQTVVAIRENTTPPYYGM